MCIGHFMAELDYKTELKLGAELVGREIERILADQAEIPKNLKEAIEYMLLGPGKRLRGVLALLACRAVCGDVLPEALSAAAIEMVHTYSLIHDDLPAMDNDDMRRGRPSCHKQFDEATAILAGDALLTMAFELLAEEIADAKMSVRMIRTLAQAAGPAGMIAGQAADMEAERFGGDMERLRHIHVNKTAEMFAAAAAMGAIAAGADDAKLEALLEYGLKLGLCFQVADDLLDVSASSEQLGKTAGKDIKKGKLTYPSLVGMERSREIALEFTNQAVSALDGFGAEAGLMRTLAGRLLERRK